MRRETGTTVAESPQTPPPKRLRDIESALDDGEGKLGRKPNSRPLLVTFGESRTD